MPELPEVETVVRGLRGHIEGRRIADCRYASPWMVQCDEGDFAERLRGRKLVRLDRHGKWMFFRLCSHDTLAIHLGMTGRLGLASAKEVPRPHTHLRLALGSGKQELRFSDPRRFGELVLCRPTTAEERFGPRRLGPEATTIRLSALVGVFSKTIRSAKAVLLDQRSIAGIGNIYADEILFAAAIHPSRHGCDLSYEEIQRIGRAIRNVLRRAIRAGGSTIRDYVNAEGQNGWFQLRHNVYGRAGQPCRRCHAPIVVDRSILTGRATHFCPICQPRHQAV